MRYKFARFIDVTVPMRMSLQCTIRKVCRPSASKGGEFKCRAFAYTLIKKLNLVAARHRVIQRNLISVSTPLAKRFRTALSDGSKSRKAQEEKNSTDVLSLSQSQEDLVPQQLWDELFEIAIEAITEEIFDEE